MKDGKPFGIGGLRENWKDPASGEWIRIGGPDPHSYARDCGPSDYTRRLSDEFDPRDLLRPFPSEPMQMWPISRRVNKLENDEPSIIEPITLTTSVA